MKGPIVVCGASGRQGGAVARELLRDGWTVRALTRHPDSARGRAMTEAGLTVVGGDLSDASSLERAFAGAHAVFGVTEFWEHGFDGEVRQGKNLVDAAVRAGAKQLVFSSVGGTDRTAGLGIRHFDSKREIEDHVRASGLEWTILRPVTFFENFVSDRFKRMIRAGAYRFAIAPDLPFQMVAMRDLGVFAAKAFGGELRGEALELASDRFTMRELCEALSQAVGRTVRYKYIPPWAQRVVGWYVTLTRTSGRYKVGPSLIAQFRWNNASPTGGWNADLARLRELHPGLLTMPAWVRSIDWSSAT